MADINLFVRAAFYLFVFSIPFEIPNRGIPVEILWLTFAIAIAAG